MITLYTVDCPRCEALERELKASRIQFEVCKDTKVMLELGMKEVPYIQLEDGSLLDFKQSVKWLKEKRSDENV